CGGINSRTAHAGCAHRGRARAIEAELRVGGIECCSHQLSPRRARLNRMTRKPTKTIPQATNGCQSGTSKIAPTEAWGRSAGDAGRRLPAGKSEGCNI